MKKKSKDNDLEKALGEIDLILKQFWKEEHKLIFLGQEQ
jgi:hypothetical protein